MSPLSTTLSTVGPAGMTPWRRRLRGFLGSLPDEGLPGRGGGETERTILVLRFLSELDPALSGEVGGVELVTRVGGELGEFLTWQLLLPL